MSKVEASGGMNVIYLVTEVPDGDTNATLDRHALLDDSRVVGLLLVERVRRRRQRHADIELSDGDFKTEGGELVHDRRHARGDLTDDEVALETDTVELHAGVKHRFGEVEESSSLCTGVLIVVLVDVELGSGIGGRCSLESDVDVCRAKGVVENIRAPGSVVIA